MKNGRQSSQRTRRWNSIGSVGFVLTLLSVLGLGGGFVLALLPFSSADRSAAAPRNLPEFRSTPPRHLTPLVEPLRDAETRKVVIGVATAFTTAHGSAAAAIDALPSGFVATTIATDSPVDSPASIESAINIPNINAASERFSLQVPLARTSAAEFDALQTQSIPEPATWALIVFGILFATFVVTSHRQSRPAGSRDWTR